jgi:LPXTG-site transpeptidase (sortase) family protein
MRIERKFKIRLQSFALLLQWLTYIVLTAGFFSPTTNLQAATCTNVIITDNVSAANSASPLIYYYDISPQHNIQGNYVGYTITNTTGTAVPDVWVKLDTFSAATVTLAATEDGIYHLGPLAAGESKQIYFYLDINGDPGDIPALNETFQVNLYYTDPSLGSEICDYTDTINSVDETIAAVANKVHTAVAFSNPPSLGGTMTITGVGETGQIGAAHVFKLTPASLPDWPADVFKLVDVHVDYWNRRVCPDDEGSVPARAPTHTYDDVLFFTTPSNRNSCYRTVYSFIITGTTTTPAPVMPVNEISSGNKIKHTGSYSQTIDPIQNPSNVTTLGKSVIPDHLDNGGTVTYTITITSTGDTPIYLDRIMDLMPSGASYIAGTSQYNSVAIADPFITGQQLTWVGSFQVPIGGSSTLTYQVNIANTLGAHTNQAYGKIGTVQIDTTLDTTDNQPATATVTVGSAPIIAKVFSPDTIDVNGVSLLTITLTNNNGSALTGATFTDTYPAEIVNATPLSYTNTCNGTVNASAGGVSVGLSGGIIPANGSCSISINVTSSLPGTHTNTIGIGALTTSEGFSNTSEASDDLFVRSIQLELVKTVAESEYDEIGDVLHYSYRLTNRGNVTLSGPYSVTDDKASDESCTFAGTLAPGEFTDCTGSYSITQADLDAGSVTNLATGYAVYGGNPVTSNQDSETVNAAASVVLELDKTVAESEYDEIGDVLHYSYRLTNRGNVTLSGPYSVTDDKASDESCTFAGTLAPGEYTECTGSYTITQADLDAGSVTNLATGYATYGGNPVTSNQDSETVNAAASVSLTSTKVDSLLVDADNSGNASAGDTLHYVILLTNNSKLTATGVVFDDTPDTNTSLISGTVTTSQGTVDKGNTPGDTSVKVTLGNIAANGGTASIEFDVRINTPLPQGTWRVLNQGIFTGGNFPNLPTDDPDLPGQTDPTQTILNTSFGKSVVDSSQSFTPSGTVAIGEMLTYQLVVQVMPGAHANVRIVDNLPLGMAYVSCLSITPESGDLVTDVVGGFPEACASPQVEAIPPADPNPENQGRQVTFSLGNLTNNSGDPLALTLQYRVVVLDSAANHDGDTLVNTAQWFWDTSQFETSSPPQGIVEPKMQVVKSVDRNTALPGTVLTFTLRILHDPDSHADAFDLEILDALPPQLTYVPNSLRYVSGKPVNFLDDSQAPILKAYWTNFENDGQDSVIEFQAVLGALGAGESLTNVAYLKWTSLPGNVSAPQSRFNELSTERDYDPDSPVDVYQTDDYITITVPLLPATGFAPGVVTSISRQPGGFAYLDLGEISMEIPKLGIHKPITGVPLVDGNWQLKWIGDSIGYLDGTTYPTWPGNSALTAHVYLPNGMPGPFVNLGELAFGDEVIVHAFGQKHVFEVRSKAYVWPEDIKVLKEEKYNWLTLITCHQYDEKNNSYRVRTVVRAVLVRVE